MINSFSIFKNEPTDNPKSPTHSISAKIGEEYRTIGKCWTKDGAKGKFLSCQLSDVYQDKPGYEIELKLPQTNKPVVKVIDPANGRDLTPDDSNPF